MVIDSRAWAKWHVLICLNFREKCKPKIWITDLKNICWKSPLFDANAERVFNGEMFFMPDLSAISSF